MYPEEPKKTTENFKKLVKHLEGYVDKQIKKYEQDQKTTYSILEKLLAADKKLYDTEYVPQNDGSVYYQRVTKPSTEGGMDKNAKGEYSLGELFQWMIVGDSVLSAATDSINETGRDPAVKTEINEDYLILYWADWGKKIPDLNWSKSYHSNDNYKLVEFELNARSVPKDLVASINQKSKAGVDLQVAIDLADNVRKYYKMRSLRYYTEVYSHEIVRNILQRSVLTNRGFEDIKALQKTLNTWKSTDVDALFTKAEFGDDLDMKLLELTGYSYGGDYFFTSDGREPVILDDNPWAGTDLLLNVLKDELGVVTPTEPITCDENGCSGTYVGPEFDQTQPDGKQDVAHQFSNKMAAKVGDKLKELYKAGKYKQVDFSKIEMKTEGMDGKDDVTYFLKIPFKGVTEKCDAYTSFEHVGGWGHEPELQAMVERLESGLLEGEELDISDKMTTPQGLEEYWIQWKNKDVQADCAKPAAVVTQGETVKVSGELIGTSWDDMHTFSTKKVNDVPWGAKMHAGGGGVKIEKGVKKILGGWAGGYVHTAMKKFYKEKKLNPCVVAIKITIDPNIGGGKKKLKWEVTIGESPDGKAYMAIGSWGGAGGSATAPSSHAYDNYAKEKEASISRYGGEAKDVLDYWYPAGFRQIFYQFTMPGMYKDLPKSANYRSGKVGVSIGPAGSPTKLPLYNDVEVPTVTYDSPNPNVNDPNNKPKAEVKKEPAEIKFKLTPSSFETQWQPPTEHQSGLPANSDLPSFYIFVGDEQKEQADELTGFSDIGYDQLDSEYVEDTFVRDKSVKFQSIGDGWYDTGYKQSETVFESSGYEGGSGAPAVVSASADYWALICCCLYEDGNYPYEVAQCIYNRYGAEPRSKGAYGRTLKEIVLKPGQFSVTNNYKDEWKALDTFETAINLVMKKSGTTRKNAISKLEKIETALRDPANQQKALGYVGGRTGFRSPETGAASSWVSLSWDSNRRPRGNKFFWEAGTKGHTYYYVKRNPPAGVPTLISSGQRPKETPRA